MKAPQTLIRELAGAFRDGLTRPRASALAGALIVLVAQAALVSPRFLATIDPGYIGSSWEDTGANASLAAMRLRYAPPGGYTVVILGNSPLRECIESEDSIASLLSLKLSYPVSCTGVYLGLASYLEIGAFADQVPPGLTGAVLIEVSPMLLSYDAAQRARDTEKQPWIALDSPFLDRELESIGMARARTGVHLLDHLAFYTARHDMFWRWLARQPLRCPVHLHMIERHMADRDEKRARMEQREERLAEDYDRFVDANLERLRRIIAPLRERRLQVVLVDSPRSPEREERLHEVNQRYRARIAAFARTEGVALIDPLPGAQLEERAFYDAVHLINRAARRKFDAAFAAALAPVLVLPGAEARR